MIALNIQKSLQSAQGCLTLDIDCQIEARALTTLYGVSGAGKTTLLRILAGLLNPEKGLITVSGETWLDTNKKLCLPPQQRSIGFVFQDYALFPNMTVRGNLEYALEKGSDKQVVDELTEVMELEQLQNRYPATLSGGQKQRVALARALVRKPRLLLLDEPLAALDHEMRLKLQDHILKVHKAYGLTTILVSHDIAEIYKMADRILVLEEGRIMRQGSAAALFGNHGLSSKFQAAGEVLSIEKEDIVYLVTVLISNAIIKVIATDADVQTLRAGDKVMVSSKAFNPIISRIGL